MKQRQRIVVSLPPSLRDRLSDTAGELGISESLIVEQALNARLPDKSSRFSPVVEFLLRHGKPDSKPSWQNGGRWFLDWLLLKEPDWQRHHLVMLPRCWPVPYRDREPRCSDNVGDPRSLIDHLNELRDPFHRDDAAFPRDLPDPSLEEWQLVCRLFEGCCGEKIRPPDGPHWDAACENNS